MRWLLAVVVTTLVIDNCVAPPVLNKEPENNKEKDGDDSVGNTVEYHRYLREVVDVLEGDPEFREKVKNLSEDDIKSAKIADELDFVNHNIRTKLDEIKRIELERLRQLATKAFEAENHIDTDHLKIAEHVDHTNPHTFEAQDLKLLILKTTADLAEEDRKRREEFKEYEMEKKFEQEEKMKKMDEEHRKKYEEELKALEKKHKEHKPLHHPGSKQQLEEVWEKQDHMESEDFDPRAFFFIHDLDGNRYWDQYEVKTLFLKELDKMYNEGAPEDDLRERAEELERMREHVFKEADTDKDGLISLKEFLEQSKKPEFNQDEGWKTVDETPVYTEEDYQAFLKQRHNEIQEAVAKGMIPPDHNSVQAGHPQQFPPQQHYQGQVPPQQQYPGQVPPQQQFHGQAPPQQQFHGQLPPQQQFQGQMPQYQGHQQVPQYQGQPQIPQYQGQQQIPQYQQLPQQHQQYGNQVPVQQQNVHPGQVPVQQQNVHPGQVPVQQQNVQPGQVPVQQQNVHPGQVPVQQQNVHPGQVPVQQQNVNPSQVPVQQQNVHPGQVPVQQKVAVPAQPQAAVPQQNAQNQGNVQGHQQVNEQQAQQRTGQNQAPVAQQAAGGAAHAPVPNVINV